MRTVISGGTVVSAIDAVAADVLIDGETIVGVVSPDSEVARTFAADAEVLDATNRLVVPGGIDAHTHFDSVSQPIAPVLDSFETGTIASAFGGTTTIIDFVWAPVGTRILKGYDNYHELADGNCAIDYGFHCMLNDVDEQTPKEMDMLVEEGITSFKMFTAYPGRMYSTDASDPDDDAASGRERFSDPDACRERHRHRRSTRRCCRAGWHRPCLALTHAAHGTRR